ncbi:hypothetical protein GCM10023350_46540 [Nocardioides endophyticus]|uniref:Glycosyltransferase family 1 protein n=1 Tax=Nocardioides endophyticus TaxID=1353775 RepID=A0ABP8ZGI0_9ACTN
MARHIVYLHLGLPGSGGGFLETALPEHAATLATFGVAHPVATSNEMFRSAVEIRRDHRTWGYRRRDVEGTWAEICRRILKQRNRVLLSQELLTGCTPDQADLLLDTLAGAEVHVVITARRADAERHEFAALTALWTAAVRHPDRVHTLVVPADVEPLGWIWSELGELVGFDAAQLPLGADTAIAAYGLARQRELQRVRAAAQPDEPRRRGLRQWVARA